MGTTSSAAAVQVTPDGGCVLAGNTYSGGGGDFGVEIPDMALLKIDSVGNPQY
jgi:hypothetical protein